MWSISRSRASLRSSYPVSNARAWLIPRDELDRRLDVLVIDEAGQYALADAVASGTAAGNLILVGEPHQLRQMLRGSQSEGVGVSALEQILAGGPTMPPDRGLLLPVTRRLQPEICAFISEVAYGRRIQGVQHPDPGRAPDP